MYKRQEQTPAIRVALRNIKDFAIPTQVKIDNEIKLFWRFFLISQNEFKEVIENKLIIKEPKKEEIEKPKQVIQEKIKEESSELIKEEKTKIKSKSPKEKIIDIKFKEKITEYLTAKKIEVLHEISIDKKEFMAKIRIDMPLGKQEFYLASKDKKTITIEDLALALQKAQSEKMPAIFISPGKPSKSAQEYLKEWKNLIKFEQVKL